jgi:hypothetical protein
MEMVQEKIANLKELKPFLTQTNQKEDKYEQDSIK